MAKHRASEPRPDPKSQVIEELLWRCRMLETFNGHKLNFPPDGPIRRSYFESLDLSKIEAFLVSMDDLSRQDAQFTYRPAGICDKFGHDVGEKSG